MSGGLVYIGLTHHTAPLEVRERCTPQRTAVIDMLARLAAAGEQAAVLSTCGRLEMYGLAADARGAAIAADAACAWSLPDAKPGSTPDPAAAPWLDRFAELCGRPLREVQPFLTVHTGRVAARQLLRVAAGLDSQILGEDQVIAQVREAYALAQAAGSCGAVLSSLFRSAIRAGRRARTETSIGRVPGSFAALAVSHLLAQGGADISRALIIGSGRMARDMATALGRALRPEVVIAARSRERAELLAAEVGGRSVDLEGLPGELAAADVVFACTSSNRFVVTADDLRRARGLEGRSAGPGDATNLHLVDLGMPRNIEPAAGGLPGVRLAGLADLAPGSTARTGLLEAVDRIVDQELAGFEKWLRGRAAAAAVARLARRLEHCDTRGRPDLRRRLHGRIMRLKEGHAA